ncbi:hypothetical protein LDENG_00142080 [Lucifuga dentata]|nr:hypothetical protein LDENG_00142080 [Lucifuga dentata]
MILYGFTHIAEALAGVTGGIIRGIGKQKAGAVFAFVCYYIIGFPIGVSLTFPAKMGFVAPDCDEKQAEMKAVQSGSLSPVEEKPESHGSGQTATLSVRQLVLRRGFTVLIMLFILAAGVFISEMLTRLLKLE